jgi:signal transduction histidine kinase
MPILGLPAQGRGMRETDFLSVASHELRTPITVIIGLAATLADRRHDLTEDQIDESLGQIRRQAERMAALVSDLLDLSQLDGGRIRVTLAPVHLAHAVEVALEAAPPPPSASVKVAVPTDLWVVAGSGRLEQVLVNLITNAYRYGGSAVDLEARRSGDEVLLTVSDDGEGVPDDLVPDLFEKYSHGASDGDGAPGLGLALVRALVQAFGGRVWYESRQPTGARFNVLLPSTNPDPLTEGDAASRPAGAG